MPKISVIIPTYNVETYLAAALESVINQTFSDIEIICINDGSTDNSLAILENYAQKDSRIKLINQHNQGVSAARNAGIEAACGEYIMFLDPDDTYDLTLCEKVVEKINTETPDIVMWGHNVFNKTKVIDNSNSLKDIRNFIKHSKVLKETIKINVYIWNKAFKRDFLEKNKINFPLGIKNAEDLVFCLKTFYQNPKYSFILEPLYNYSDDREGAATKKFANCIRNDFAAYMALVESEIYKKQSRPMKIASTNHFIGGCIYYWRKSSDEGLKKQYEKDISDFLNFIKNSFTKSEQQKMCNFRKLNLILFKYHHKKFFDVFDIRTTKTDKTIVFFGKKIKFKRLTKISKEGVL